MNKIKLSGAVQGLIFVTLGFIANSILLVLFIVHFKIENVLFLIVFGMVEMFLLFMLNQLIGDYKNEKENHHSY